MLRKYGFPHLGERGEHTAAHMEQEPGRGEAVVSSCPRWGPFSSLPGEGLTGALPCSLTPDRAVPGGEPATVGSVLTIKLPQLPGSDTALLGRDPRKGAGLVSALSTAGA